MNTKAASQEETVSEERKKVRTMSPFQSRKEEPFPAPPCRSKGVAAGL
jgi:hypothetical protein